MTIAHDNRPLKELCSGTMEVVPGVPMQCSVLAGEVRFIHQQGILDAFGITTGGSRSVGSDQLSGFLAQDVFKSFVPNDLSQRTNSPLVIARKVGGTAYGFEPSVVLALSKVFLAARRAGALRKNQLQYAERAELILEASADLGLTALIDEATGYRAFLADDAYRVKIAAFITEKEREWSNTFPAELYVQFGRLTGYAFDPTNFHTPPYWAQLNREFIYRRLDPDVEAWLAANRPNPQRRHNWHQSLTENFGLRQLHEVLWEVVGFAKSAVDLRDLRARIKQADQEAAEYQMLLPMQGLRRQHAQQSEPAEARA